MHTREVLSDAPPVVFSGVLQGRGLRETGAKGATLIEIHDGQLSHEHPVLDIVRWAVVSVDAAGAVDLSDVCNRASAAIRQAALDADGRLLAAQLRIIGASDAHGALVVEPERTKQEMILAAAEGAGEQVWLQGTVISTVAESEITGGDDVVGALMSELDAIIASDGAVQDLAQVLAPLASALTPAAFARFNPTDPVVIRELLAEVRGTLPSALAHEIS